MEKYDIQAHYNLLNIATVLEEDTLNTFGDFLKRAIEADIQSRAEWIEQVDGWIKLAAQVKEPKNSPWPNASNVKYPLVTLASLQFHARALPALINSTKPVRCRIIGENYNEATRKQANRVSHYLSHQIINEMPEWLDGTDRLLFILPMVGCVYRKNFYSDSLKRQTSVVLLPHDFIINYHATSEYARKTHRMFKDTNEVIELQRSGKYLTVNLDTPAKDKLTIQEEVQGSTNISPDEDTPVELWETHCWYDLDADGYKEPYIVTLHADTGKILRIVPRWSTDKIQFSEDHQVMRIDADEYFTQYIFLPDPTSATHGLGMGHLIGPNNEAVNTIINQLIDAGTLSNLQSGFIARGVKLPGGAMRMLPGEWKQVNTTGDDLRKSIFPMPVREPSAVLFNLLSLLINSSERVASVTDIMVGENPGQNQPATTTMAVLEQGLKVFTGVYKRIHRALAKEYQKIYELNYYYLTNEDYARVLLDQVGANSSGADPEVLEVAKNMVPPSVKEDFRIEHSAIVPASDPHFLTDGQKAMKAQSLVQKLASGFPLNSELVLRKSLEAEGHDDIEQLMQAPPPSPPADVVLKEKEFAHKVAMDKLDYSLRRAASSAEALKDMATVEEIKSKADAAKAKIDLGRYESIIKATQLKLDAIMQEDEMDLEREIQEKTANAREAAPNV